MKNYNLWPIAILCLSVLLSSWLYVSVTKQYPQWDEHNYLSLALKYYDIMRHPGFDMYSRMLAASGYLQPGYSLLIAVFLLIFGTLHTYTIALLLNGLLFALTVLGVYRYVGEQFDHPTGLAAAMLYAGLGNALFYSHFSYTETAVTAGVVWTFVFLGRSKGFFDKKNSILAGLLFAVAVMTRWIAPVFVAGPAVIVLGQGIRKYAQSSSGIRRILGHAVWFALLGIGIPAILYFIPNSGEFFSYVARNQKDAAGWVAAYRSADMANTFSTRSVMFYFNIVSQVTVYTFLLFLAGFIVAARYFRKSLPLLSAFIVPYLFLTFIAVWKEDRFLVSLYPAFAAIASLPLLLCKTRRAKTIGLSMITVLSLLTHMATSWGAGPLGRRGLTDVVLPEFIHHPRRIYLTPLVWPPTKEYLNADRIADVIRAHFSGKGRPVIGAVYTFEPLDNAFLSITEYHDRQSFSYVSMPYTKDAVLKVHPDVALLKSNDSASVLFKQSAAFAGFVPIANIPVPMDNSIVTVYAYETK